MDKNIRIYNGKIEDFCSMLRAGTKVKDNLSLPAQLKQAEKDLEQAVEMEAFEQAARKRDLIIDLKKALQNEK
tara:strand:+ start:1030 stop:1248 length:219 start_codon:yes stop_codon:yes gene_type:complete